MELWPRAQITVEERINKTSTCWLWTGYIAKNGYGILKHGKPLLAHRVSYAVYKGPIPEGLSLDHLCRVRHCVNPDHLEPVSTRENVARGISCFAVNLRRTKCVNGHALDGENLYIVRREKGRTERRCRACARNRTRNWQLRTGYNSWQAKKGRPANVEKVHGATL
jgi:HNH endonuclease